MAIFSIFVHFVPYEIITFWKLSFDCGSQDPYYRMNAVMWKQSLCYFKTTIQMTQTVSPKMILVVLKLYMNLQEAIVSRSHWRSANGRGVCMP